MDFIIVDKRGKPGAIFAYDVYLVPAGFSHLDPSREFIGSAATLWGARRIIRRERKRLKKFGERGAVVVHREAL